MSKQQMIERWNKRDDTNKAIATRRRRRKFITLGVIGGVCLLAFLFILFYRTDIIVKPVTDITVDSQPGEWAMFGRDLTHSGLTDSTNALPQGTVNSILTAGSGIRSSPVIAGGTIYVGSRDGKLYALDQATGAKLWEFQTGSWVESSPAVVNNVVYVGSNDGNLYALDAKTGQKLWNFSVKYPVQSSPAVVDGKVYFGSDDYSLYAVDAATGKKVWSKSTGDAVYSSPAIANGILYFGSVDGNFYAMDARNGRQRLIFPAHELISSSPAVVGTTVYYCTANGTLYAFDGEAKNWFGETLLRPFWMVLHIYGDLPAPPVSSGYLWSLDTRQPTSSSPLISGDNLYLGAGNKIISVNLKDHTQTWEYDTGAVVSSAVVNGNTLYVVNEGGHLVLLNAATGEKISDIAVGGSIYSNPVVSNGTVYITSDDGNLYTVN